MRPIVKRKLDQLFEYPLFQHVGSRLMPPSISQAKNWSKAVKECSSTKWLNCRIAARNLLQRRIERLYPSNPQAWNRCEEWNPLVEEIRPQILDLLDQRLAATGIPADFATKIKNSVDSDLMFICLEEEFKDLVKPPFFQPVLEPWYASGRFPCGWDGEEFPQGWEGGDHEGRLIVF